MSIRPALPRGDCKVATLPARRREGRYLLRTNLCECQPVELWQFYIPRYVAGPLLARVDVHPS
jgi:hypothetical protein